MTARFVVSGCASAQVAQSWMIDSARVRSNQGPVFDECLLTYGLIQHAADVSPPPLSEGVEVLWLGGQPDDDGTPAGPRTTAGAVFIDGDFAEM